MATSIQHSIARLGKSLGEYKKDATQANIAVGDLVPYARQARTIFDAVDLAEMAETIKTVGILQPLLVRPKGGGKYEIICGERRWRAAKIAGLPTVPVLVKIVDDETADQIHLYENIHRENLKTLELATRVEEDIKNAQGDLAVVALKYKKSKSWLSKLATIAGGGQVMGELVHGGVTSDRAVLSTVAAVERKAPARAKALIEKLKTAPASANKRAIAEDFAKEVRASHAPKARRAVDTHEAGEPAWRSQAGIRRELATAVMTVEISPVSEQSNEFKKLSQKHGAARLANDMRHAQASYAIVEFGESGLTRRAYRADELRLLTVR